MVTENAELARWVAQMRDITPCDSAFITVLGSRGDTRLVLSGSLYPKEVDECDTRCFFLGPLSTGTGLPFKAVDKANIHEVE